jgi:hypothetical protein
MAQINRLKPVGEDEPLELITDPPPPRAAPPPQGRDIQVLTTMLLTALKALSQRTIVALASLVDLALASSVFVLWVLVIAQPTTLQLIGLGGYAMFVLLALYMRRKG